MKINIFVLFAMASCCYYDTTLMVNAKQYTYYQLNTKAWVCQVPMEVKDSFELWRSSKLNKFVKDTFERFFTVTTLQDGYICCYSECCRSISGEYYFNKIVDYTEPLIYNNYIIQYLIGLSFNCSVLYKHPTRNLFNCGENKEIFDFYYIGNYTVLTYIPYHGFENITINHLKDILCYDYSLGISSQQKSTAQPTTIVNLSTHSKISTVSHSTANIIRTGCVGVGLIIVNIIINI